MESRDPAHLPSKKGSALVPAQRHEQPLLPYERQLIQALGISEQEYRWFADEVRYKGLTRPKGYELVPDVQAGFIVPILINLAIGAVLTAVGALLAPKPKAPERDQVRQRTLASEQGRTRFNKSQGFDSAPNLADLGSRVPIPFGRYETYADAPPGYETDVGETGEPSGGMIVEPLLVWSRMLSNGSFQSLKVMCVIGQVPIAQPPSIQGVMIGGQPIANFYKSNYAFFWSSNYGPNHLSLANLIAGDAAPDGNFLAPSATQVNGRAFSAAYSPSNNASFGLYKPLFNGAHWRVNWRVISIPKEQDSEGRERSKIERLKIAGKEADDRKQGMPGLGRAYSTRMGLVGVNGGEVELPTVVTVSKGDYLTYRISGAKFKNGELGFPSKYGVTADDLNSQVNSFREAADDALQLNEIFVCNRTLLKVVQRPNDVWREGKTFDYTLEVIGVTGGNYEIGLGGRRAINKAVLSEGATFDEAFRSVSWYPLHCIDIAQVANTRPTEVTELGIRSQVWTQLNGLCNFNSIPTPSELIRFDNSSVQITNGTYNKYTQRTSFFILAVKDTAAPQGVDATGADVSDSDYLFDGFDTINGALFAVQNNAPVDVYNYIRVKHPGKSELEFKLVPKDACNIHRYDFYVNQQIYLLSPAGSEYTHSEDTVYGRFELTMKALRPSIEDLFDLKELDSGDTERVRTMICTVRQLSTVGPVGGDGQVGNLGGGYSQAYFETILGQLKDPSNPGGGNRALFGERRTVPFSFVSQGVTFNCTMTGVVGGAYISDSDPFFQQNGTTKYWTDINVVVQSTVGNVSEGEIYDHTISIGASWYAYWYGRSGPATYRYAATGVICREGEANVDFIRMFEPYAQIKELSVYNEITRSCSSTPEHSIVYLNESMDDLTPAEYGDLSMVGIKLRTQNQVQSFQQPQIYLKDGISLTRLEDGQFGPTNNFADVAYWLLTEEGRAMGSEISERLVDKDSFIKAARFIRQTRCRFDGAITDRTNLRSWLTQMAPLFLCNFVIKNGKFALVPGVPVQASGELDTGPVQVSAIFTDGNIIDGSFELDYLEQAERQDFKAVMKYRESKVNSLAVEQSLLVRFKDDNLLPQNQEDYDMTQFCTRRGHAFLVARYLLSLRRRIDHVVKFQTIAQGLSLAPGDYIRVDVTAAPYDTVNNVVVREDLTLLTPGVIADGTYPAAVFRQGSDEVVSETVTIKASMVTDPTLAEALMNVNPIPRRYGIYMVDQLTLTEDGLVDIIASHFPVFDDGRSKIVDDILHDNRYIKFEVIE